MRDVGLAPNVEMLAPLAMSDPLRREPQVIHAEACCLLGTVLGVAVTRTPSASPPRASWGLPSTVSSLALSVATRPPPLCCPGDGACCCCAAAVRLARACWRRASISSRIATAFSASAASWASGLTMPSLLARAVALMLLALRKRRATATLWCFAALPLEAGVDTAAGSGAGVALGVCCCFESARYALAFSLMTGSSKSAFSGAARYKTRPWGRNSCQHPASLQQARESYHKHALAERAPPPRGTCDAFMPCMVEPPLLSQGRVSKFEN